MYFKYVSGLVCKNEKKITIFLFVPNDKTNRRLNFYSVYIKNACFSITFESATNFFLQKTSNGLDHCELKKENSKIFCHTFNR